MVVIFGGASNQEATFRLTNMTAPDGRFSINVIFPVIGSYQVLTRITSQTHDVSSLASFTVIVPALQSASNLFGGNYIIWISLLFAAGAAGASFFILLISIHNPGPLVWSTQTSILSLALYINRTRKSTLPYSHVLARS